MIGRRVEWAEQIMAPGEYAKSPDGTWYAETPNGHGGNFAEHEVTEHEDGTITVSPSILVTYPAITRKEGDTVIVVRPEVQLWHGYLERGVWREC